MPDGGKIKISTENIYLDSPIDGCETVKEGEYAVLKISDNGVGIAKEDLEKIFEPFYTKKKMGRSGTGLGMAVVLGTVKDHNGYIVTESTERKGTTFTLYFPATIKDSQTDSKSIPVENYTGNGEKILVVDDVDLQREIASNLLKKLNYMVETVCSGEKAIEYMKNNTADLIVIDMIMPPGIDGFDTYKRIIKIHPAQKAIIASGFSETERVREAQKIGAGSYIKKPYTLEKIGAAVKAELQRT
jgi:CheY-like chemotaxis protein